MPKTLPAPKKAAQLGVGRVYIPKVSGGPGYCPELPHSFRVEGIEQTLKELQRQVADFRAQLYAPFFKIEKADTQKLNNELTWRLEFIDYATRVLRPRIHNYKLLSSEPLTWCDDQGFPKLVIAPIDEAGNVEISASRDNWHYRPYRDSGNLDDYSFNEEIIKPCYQAVGERLLKQAPYGGSISIKTDLGDLLIPRKTREKIQSARAHFGNQIFIIVEAPKWEINVVVPPKRDPLIVGFEDGLLFLIDQFNLTRLERVVAAEYTLG